MAVLTDLLSPDQCWKKYLLTDDKAALACDTVNEDDFEAEGVVEVPSGPMASVKEGFNRATGLLFDTLLDLVSGKHFADCQQLASQPAGFAKALQDTDSDSQELLKQLRLITSMFDGHTKLVAASTSAPMPSLLSQLTSANQSADADADRERHWKMVQTERRKFVSLGVPRSWTKDGLLAAYRSCGKVFAHNGLLNTSHRLLTASADLIAEKGDEPWLTPTAPSPALCKDIVEFMSSSATGTADFIMAFDGRLRECRRIIAPWLSMHLVFQ